MNIYVLELWEMNYVCTSDLLNYKLFSTELEAREEALRQGAVLAKNPQHAEQILAVPLTDDDPSVRWCRIEQRSIDHKCSTEAPGWIRQPMPNWIRQDISQDDVDFMLENPHGFEVAENLLRQDISFLFTVTSNTFSVGKYLHGVDYLQLFALVEAVARPPVLPRMVREGQAKAEELLRIALIAWAKEQ